MHFNANAFRDLLDRYASNKGKSPIEHMYDEATPSTVLGASAKLILGAKHATSSPVRKQQTKALQAKIDYLREKPCLDFQDFKELVGFLGYLSSQIEESESEFPIEALAELPIDHAEDLKLIAPFLDFKTKSRLNKEVIPHLVYDLFKMIHVHDKHFHSRKEFYKDEKTRALMSDCQKAFQAHHVEYQVCSMYVSDLWIQNALENPDNLTVKNKVSIKEKIKQFVKEDLVAALMMHGAFTQTGAYDPGGANDKMNMAMRRMESAGLKHDHNGYKGQLLTKDHTFIKYHKSSVAGAIQQNYTQSLPIFIVAHTREMKKIHEGESIGANDDYVFFFNKTDAMNYCLKQNDPILRQAKPKSLKERIQQGPVSAMISGLSENDVIEAITMSEKVHKLESKCFSKKKPFKARRIKKEVRVLVEKAYEIQKDQSLSELERGKKLYALIDIIKSRQPKASEENGFEKLLQSMKRDLVFQVGQLTRKEDKRDDEQFTHRHR